MADEDSFETWNMAKAYLMRIDKLLTLCDQSQMELNGNLWCSALVNLYKEIDAKLIDTEREHADKLLKELLQHKNEHEKKQKAQISTDKFMAFELYLRRMLEKKNLLTPKGDDPTRAYRSG